MTSNGYRAENFYVTFRELTLFFYCFVKYDNFITLISITQACYRLMARYFPELTLLSIGILLIAQCPAFSNEVKLTQRKLWLCADAFTRIH
jgi:hypothetical protein